MTTRRRNPQTDPRLPEHAEDSATLYSEPAEQAVLSAIFADPACLDQVRARMTAEAFFRTAHASVFRACCAVVDHGSTIDPLTIATHLDDHRTLDAAGGREYLAYLIDVVPTAANVLYHVGIVADLAARRAVIRTARALQAAAADRAISLAESARAATAALLPTAAETTRGGYVAVGDLVIGVSQDISDAHTGIAAGLAFGYRDLDRATGGMLPGEVLFLCSVPGGCKTALALNVALKAAERGEGVAFVSAEMKDRSLVKRLVSNRAEVPGIALRTGRIQDAEFVQLGAALGALSRLPFWIDDTPEPDVDVIRARARALKAQHPALRWLVVDFIQLVVSGKDADDGRARELSRISYAMKGLAKELDVAVIATCQVDAAGIEKRGDKRPQLGDMQWSQAMRQAGDFVALLYRPAMYTDDVADLLELDFRKARDLEPFKVTLAWNGRFMRVENRGWPA